MIAFLTTSCLSVDLTARPCPCLDGFVCVDDVCVDPADLDDDPDAGQGDGDDDDDDDDAGVPDDAGEPPDPDCVSDEDCAADPGAPICGDDGRCVECIEDGDCGPGLLCDEASGNCLSGGGAECEPGFDDDDACAAGGFTSGTLVETCSDDRIMTAELLVEIAQLGTNCIFPDSFAHQLVATDLSGTVALGNDGDGNGPVLTVDVTGTLTFDVQFPAECFEQGCDPDACSVSDSGCECTLTIDGSAQFEAQSAGNDGVFFSDQSQVSTCGTSGALLVRETAAAAGFFGPVMLFQ